MYIDENNDLKSEALMTSKDEQIEIPHHIPVDSYIQEAEILYHWAQPDKDALTASGLDWALVEAIPDFSEALTRTEAQWQARKYNEAAARKWVTDAPLAYDLRRRLLRAFCFAYRNNPTLLAAARALGKGKKHTGMIQDLNDLAVLGKENPELLQAIHFDMSLLDKAAQMSGEMTEALARVTTLRTGYNQAKKIRDLAYTNLKKAVDEVYAYGRFVFRRNDERHIGYISQYLRKKRNRQKADEKERPPSVTT
jgi:hypothetical protein